MIKYNYIVVASFRGLNDDVIVDYCETENEAITKMEEIEDYKSHSSIDSVYGQIDWMVIYKINGLDYIAPTVQNVISTKLCEMLKMDNVEQIKCEIKSIINYIDFGCNKD